MNSLKELGEFGLIDRIRENFTAPKDILGIGDDCAVLPQKNGLQTLVSTDMLVEGTHFLLDDISPEDLGWKSAAVNFSDIAASGGKPVGTFLSLALPKGPGCVDSSWMEGFIRGYREMSDSAGAPLLGGDTTSSPDRLCINVTVLGQVRQGGAKLRSSACPGDLVCVTGTLGDSAAGLRQILQSLQRTPELVRSHYRPEPRLEWGIRLGGCDSVHAMMDISDGVGSDLRHILDASGTGARIDLSALPFSPELLQACMDNGWDPKELALCGGEDYELLFTLAPGGTVPDVPFTVIGTITEDRKLVWEGGDMDYMGFRHFFK